MRNIFYLFLVSTFLYSCSNSQTHLPKVDQSETTLNETSEGGKFAIVLHGGAGTILKENMSDSLEQVYREILKKAITTGHEILKNGGSSLDAVTATINIMEDSPLFNAGRGAVFTHEGRNELDASIMDGSNLKAGAVAGVRHIKNPINLARDVMDKSSHVMLYGSGAEEFATSLGYQMMDTTYFYTKDRYNSLQKVLKKGGASILPSSLKNEAIVEQDRRTFEDPFIKESKFGTVGCVALDKYGNLAAGTSTGGMTNKRWNRIGDSPIIGAGTYANNATCAVSSTGWGEFFIRLVLAYDVSAMMQYKNMSLEDAAKEVIQHKLPKLGGDGGIVAMDKDANIVMEFNTPGMYRASINKDGELFIGMYKEEK